MALNPKLLDVIACPACKGKLHYDKNTHVLICKFNHLAFPIKDGVPIMLVSQAKTVKQD
jgi:uncharacterized protein